MSVIRLQKFDGMVTATHPKLLPDSVAQYAENCRLVTGVPEPFHAMSNVQALSWGVRTAYPWTYTDALGVEQTQWLQYGTDADFAKPLVANDQYDRIFVQLPTLALYFHGTLAGIPTQRYANVQKPSAPTINATAPVVSTLTDAHIQGIQARRYGWTTLQTLPYGYPAGWFTTTGTMLSFEREGNDVILHYQMGPYYFYGPSTTALVDQLTIPYSGVLPTGTPPTTLGPNDVGKILTQTLSVYNVSGTLIGTMKCVETAVENQSIQSITGTTVQWMYLWLRFRLRMVYATGQDTTQNVRYRRTYLNDFGMQGPASDASAAVEVQAGQGAVLTLQPEAWVWGPVDRQRIYRTLVGSAQEETVWRYVDEILANATSYTDTKKDVELGEQMPLMENSPDGSATDPFLQGLRVMAGGFGAAFRNNELLFSEPYMLHSWPSKYRLTIEDTAVGIETADNSLVVMTNNRTLIFTGDHPSAISRSEVDMLQPCKSKRSICRAGRYVIYAGQDGLVGVMGGQAFILTKDVFTPEQWRALSPESMFCRVKDDIVYVGIEGTSQGLVVELLGNSVRVARIDFTTGTDTWCYWLPDTAANVLYVIRRSGGDSYLDRWDGAATYLTQTWWSKNYQLTHPQAWKWARVLASGYPITMTLYAEETALTAVTIPSADTVILPKYRPERDWSVRVSGAYQVEEVALATSREELRR